MNKEYLENCTELIPQFEKRGGLLPAIAQDNETKEVLMLGYVNQLAIEKTIELGYATFWKTSTNKLWTKGLTSGDKLRIEEIRIDCDQDAILYLVTKEGAGACHTQEPNGQNRNSCFYRRIKQGKLEFIVDKTQ